MTAGGASLDDAHALMLALAEGLERYCASVFKSDQLLSASAEALGRDALDLDTIPRCSHAELLNTKCPLSVPNKRAVIRWVRGVSLMNGTVTYIPAVLVYLNCAPVGSAERLCLPISTGCAAHTSYERALLNAVLEVVERDAISIVWLQRLTLPRVVIDSLSTSLLPYLSDQQDSLLKFEFFDATTDVGIPTIYGLQIDPTNPRLTTLVSCSTDLDPVAAIAKVIRDMAAIRVAFSRPRPIPEKWENYKDLMDGATYMARAEQAGAFDFLRQSNQRRLLSELTVAESTGDIRRQLSAVLERLRRMGLDAYAVDLSTDEAIRCGMSVVRVVIPGLQPLSFHYRARYLGHPRLYQAPKAMGHPVYLEDRLNELPQPFA
jgi:ribosomal protein S12 methylthiotransferase accessory factor